MKPQLIGKLYEAVEWAERNRQDPGSLASMAAKAGLSAYHFNRIFKSMTGMSPGLYLRRRRLTRAAQKISEEKADIIQCAYDAGYDSQEAFTRAFKDMFGVTPGQFRSECKDREASYQVPLTLSDLEHFSGGGLTMQPEFRHREGFAVTGLSRDFEYDQIWGINTLWEEFTEQLERIACQPEVAYGVCRGTMNDGQPSKVLNYTAGYEEAGIAPEHMVTIDIPENDYAVFLHTGHISAMDATLRYIWQIWLPRGGVELADAPDFERYDARFNPQTLDGEVEIWIPLKL